MSTIRIKKSELKRLIKEVHSKVISEKVDHESAKEIVTHASRLLKAVEVFKINALPGPLASVETILAELIKHLEHMVNNTPAYLEKKKAKFDAVDPEDSSPSLSGDDEEDEDEDESDDSGEDDDLSDLKL